MEVTFLIFQSKLTLSVLVAFVVTLLSVMLLKSVAINIGLQDKPGGRKHHQKPTPVIGGICMFIGFCFALLTLEHSLQPFRAFLGAQALLVLVGLLDDLHELSAKARLIAQILAASLMVLWGHHELHTFGNLLFLGSINLGFLAIPITIFAAVGAINAVNMIDGVDGLLGTVATIQLGFLSYLAWEAAAMTSVAMLALIIATLMAYLGFNFPFSKKRSAGIFMGDAGSMFIGLALTWFFISLSQNPHSEAAPVTMLWIFAIPLFDTTRLLIKRTLIRKNPLAPARDHLHHLLNALGLSNLAICLLVGSATVLLGLIGLLGIYFKVATGTQFYAFLSVFIGYCVVVNLGWRSLAKASASNPAILT